MAETGRTTSVVITVRARTVPGLWDLATSVAAEYAPGLEVRNLQMVEVASEEVRGRLRAEFQFEVFS